MLSTYIWFKYFQIASVVDYAIQDAKDELRKQTEHCLIVGYNADGNKAFLSFYHPHSCRVLETICFKGRVRYVLFNIHNFYRCIYFSFI